MLLPSRVAGRTLGLRGPDLARGPEVARPCPNLTTKIESQTVEYLLKSVLTVEYLLKSVLGSLWIPKNNDPRP